MSRRSFNRTAVASAFAAIAPQAPGSQDKSPRGTVLKESARRDVIKQDLPASRSVSSHWWKLYTRQERARRRNGVMAFVVAGSIASKVADWSRLLHSAAADPPLSASPSALRYDIAGFLGARPGEAHEREEELAGIFGHRHVPRMLKPDEMPFESFWLVKPCGRDLRMHIPVMATHEQNHREP